MIIANHLNGDQSYLLSNPFLKSISLRVHSVYKTLHCVCCETIHLPTRMLHHLESHGLKLRTDEHFRLFEQALQEFDVSQTENIAPPTPLGPPVECLKVTHGGYCCNHCSYCVPTQGSFKNHWSSSVHKNDKGSHTSAHHRGSIQTFYYPTWQCWFEVNPALAGLSPLDPFSVYLTTESTRFIKTLNPSPTHVREIPPLLKLTGWQEHLHPYIQTKADVQKLHALVRLPPFKETTGLARLRIIVDKYMRDVRAKAQACPIGIKCLLMQCPRCVFIFIIDNSNSFISIFFIKN